jgi:hypothetical protein
VLHTLIGYTARPDGIQVLFYLVTLGGILTMMKIVNSANRAASLANAAVAARSMPKHSI